MKLATAVVLGLGLAVPVGTGEPLGNQESPEGIVVESVGADGTAHSLAIQAGDVLARWERAANPPLHPQSASGELWHPFDLVLVEIEEAPRGEVTFFGARAGGPLQVSFDASQDWEVLARPHLVTSRVKSLHRGSQLLKEGCEDCFARGVQLLEQLASDLTSDGRDPSWLEIRLARLAADQGRWDVATRALKRGLSHAEGARAVVLRKLWGTLLQDNHRYAEALEEYQVALEFHRTADHGQSLLTAWLLDGLATAARLRGDLVSAVTNYRASLSIHQRLAPASLRVASSLSNLAIVAAQQGKLQESETLFQQALEIEEQVAPQSVEAGSTLNGLSVVKRLQGDLDTSMTLAQRALRIREAVTPGSLEVAATLSNLGVLCRARGDLRAAESFYRRALAIQEEQDAGGGNLAAMLGNLAIVTAERGELALAEEYFEQVLDIRERLAPNSLDVASTLNNLGVIARMRGDAARARVIHQRALEIRQQKAHESLDVAESLHNLAEASFDLGLQHDSKSLLQKALKIAENRAPAGLVAATVLEKAGRTASAMGELPAAETYHRRALRIRERLAPGSVAVAESAHSLGAVLRRGDRREEALHFLLLAIEGLESQSGRLGGSIESKADYFSRNSDLYRVTADLLLELGQEAEAFHVSERYRARSLLTLLAERRLTLDGALGDDLRADRAGLRLRHDRILAQLGQLQVDDEKTAVLREALAINAAKLRELRARTRAAAPRLAALENPEPLSVGQARAILADGELLLAYLIGEEDTTLFAVGPRPLGLEVLQLEVGRASIAAAVKRLRSFWRPGIDDEAWAREQAAELTTTLLEPVARRIALAERIVFVPDGPLHYAPVAALRDPNSGSDFKYLVESRPLSIVASATVLGELRNRREDVLAAPVVAFGAPSFGESTPSNPQETLRLLLKGKLRLDPLPHSRVEAEEVGSLFSGRSTVYIGSAATEEAARRLGPRVSILHFATHALVDEALPLESALVLSIPEEWQEGQENGLLQAWEVFEDLRIEASLVTLSACETALGQEMGGEGLVGLTRAFQFAGARTVLASIWSVSDERTSRLMERFYRYLQQGARKDDALRKAQVDLIQDAELRASHPFFWSGFQLIGDAS